jgi:hypothetical protein
VSAVDSIIPTSALDQAHTCLDVMIEKVYNAENLEWHTADDIWIQVLNSVDKLTPEQQKQNLALLLVVALQRLANHP